MVIMPTIDLLIHSYYNHYHNYFYYLVLCTLFLSHNYHFKLISIKKTS